MTYSSSVLEARAKLEQHVDSQPLDITISALVQVQHPDTADGTTARVALIQSIFRRYPTIEAWVNDFFDVDFEDPKWDIDYVDAIMLARHNLGL